MWWPLVIKQRLSKIIHLLNDRFSHFCHLHGWFFFVGPGISATLDDMRLPLPSAKEAFDFMLLFASTLGALLSQVVGCIYGYLAYREAGLSRLARRWATSHREAVICYALGWDTLGKQWTSIMSCVLGNPFEMDNQWIIVIKNAETNQQTLAFEPINRYSIYSMY